MGKRRDCKLQVELGEKKAGPGKRAGLGKGRGPWSQYY